LPGKYIANIKISRVGGLIRALRLIEELKILGWPIIIGCHVGETSLLTRAALVAASAAGESLIAQEGAFGDYLVEREPVDPMLKFGREGLLNLSFPYYLKNVQGLKIVSAENWNIGLECRAACPLFRTMVHHKSFFSKCPISIKSIIAFGERPTEKMSSLFYTEV